MANREIAILAAKHALANVGVQEETGNNDGKYIDIYQQSCEPPIGKHGPWCAGFVVYRYTQAALYLEQDMPDDYPKSGWCPSFSRWAKKNGLWTPAMSCVQDSDNVRVGDQCLFYFKTLGRLAHTGIVVELDSRNRGVWTVEGNTSPEPSDYSTVERDGDGVYKKWRTWGEFGQFGGFARIDF